MRCTNSLDGDVWVPAAAAVVTVTVGSAVNQRLLYRRRPPGRVLKLPSNLYAVLAETSGVAAVTSTTSVSPLAQDRADTSSFRAPKATVAPDVSQFEAPSRETPVNVHPAGASISTLPFVMLDGVEPSVNVKTR